MKIFYWSPHTSYVATIKAVLNSAISLKEYGENKYDVSIINANGEWNNFISNKIKFINLFSNIYYRTFPITGFVKSRISYLYIFIRYFNNFYRSHFGSSDIPIKGVPLPTSSTHGKKQNKATARARRKVCIFSSSLFTAADSDSGENIFSRDLAT